MRIDSHQHFWVYDSGQYPWINEQMKTLARDFLPEDLRVELDRCQLDGSVAVQARQSLEESRWLLELADRHPTIRAVVGWVDLRHPDVAGPLAELSRHPKFCGVRHVVQDEPDDRFMLGADFLRGLEQLHAFNLTYDLLIYPRQLPASIEVVRRFPEQPFVLDHLAKPSIRTGEFVPWREQIAELASYPNVCCKVSGMVTEAEWGRWQPEDFRPCLEAVFGAFGEDRVMYGSDWPVCLLSAGYEQVYRLAHDYVRALPAPAQEKFFGGNTARFYGFG